MLVANLVKNMGKYHDQTAAMHALIKLLLFVQIIFFLTININKPQLHNRYSYQDKKTHFQINISIALKY